MWVDVCRFVDGVHVSGPSNCAHMQEADQEGPIQPVGWTAQNADVYEEVLREERRRDGP